MAEFICRNEDCENNGKEIYNGFVTYRMLGDKLIADERFCTICNSEMEEIKKYSGTEGFNLKESFGSINKDWSKDHGKTIY